MANHELDAIFRPRSIAVIGTSRRRWATALSLTLVRRGRAALFERVTRAVDGRL